MNQPERDKITALLAELGFEKTADLIFLTEAFASAIDRRREVAAKREAKLVTKWRKTA